jgi:hypothetical protein
MIVCLAIALVALHRAMADRVNLETQTLDSMFALADILDARDTYTHGRRMPRLFADSSRERVASGTRAWSRALWRGPIHIRASRPHLLHFATPF